MTIYNFLHQVLQARAFIVTSPVKIPTTSPLQSSSLAHVAIMGLFVMLRSHTDSTMT